MICLFSAVIGCHLKKCVNMTGIKTFTTTVIPINEHKLTLNWQILKFLCDKLQIMCDTGCNYEHGHNEYSLMGGL